ncbi:NUDIX hydrolase [Haloglomus litoreum]|uniref:NUDIX hydrolase n=1 Tax=Haloglomus litoreum TaxID=3034026 RepID=UPI0023E88784|nr:NUDIX hydrolase [Haloglomus sp. DT116]
MTDDADGGDRDADADTDAGEVATEATPGATDPLAWETLDSTTDYDCPGFTVRRDAVRLPDGTETDFHSVENGASVIVLPFTEGGDVVLVEEWRQAVGRVNRGLPAGNVEGDEALADAARRELTEETGYEAAAVEFLVAHEPSNGLLDATFHYFVAHGCEPTGEQNLDDNESIRVTTASFDELRDAALGGGMRDGRSALGVLQYALRTD